MRAGATGRLYGKVLDDLSGSPAPYVVVQVFKASDTTSKKIINGGLSESNGDFGVDGIPVGEELRVVFSFPGYADFRLSTVLTSSSPMPPIEKDLGNIRMKPASLKAVEVIDEAPSMKLEFDRRVFDVSKNGLSAGGTGEDVLRNIPSLNVDVDGNVSLRNAAPTIFVDGRPTTLSIDQIPADAIQKVEIITNPSAKYDAGSGESGIVNIILKHDRNAGYNGSVRAGVDKRMRGNGGFDFNVRQGKFNFFAGGNINQRRTMVTGNTDRYTRTRFSDLALTQTQQTINDNVFANGRAGVDWFMDNRNTLTLSGNYTEGRFKPWDNLVARTDTLASQNPDAFSIYYRTTNTKRAFSNLGSSLQYKHLFAREGEELTADINYNAVSSKFQGDYYSVYNDGFRRVQKQTGGVQWELYTSQVDYTLKRGEKSKIEAGMRGAVRNYTSGYNNYIRDEITASYILKPQLAVNYAYIDQVYAAYGTYSNDWGKWKTQVGMRAESSVYKGRLLDTAVTFGNRYPLAVLPSLFITRMITDKQDIQLAAGRKISRPSFMQLSPFTDLSDSLNVSRGNPSLRPEFNHNVELSWQYVPNKKTTFLVSAYTRYTTNITVRYQLREYNPILRDTILVNTFDNAKYSVASGLEFMSKNVVTEWLELTANVNVYSSKIDGTNISRNLTNQLSSWWTKVNAQVRLPKGFSLQLLGDYSSRKALDVGSTERGGGGGGGGGMGGGGGGGFGGSSNSVQGYIRPQYGLDISLRKEFFNRQGAVNLAFSDVFRTRVNYSHNETAYFVQDTFRRRDPQFWRLNVSWKFGKVDASLFKRKNMKSSGESGMEG
jgi:outer membrane receptor protein involved in Fe transport